MDRHEELRQWFSLAEQNLGIAKHLVVSYHPTPVETICNQCQQSAEKDLKGYLFINNIEPPKIHDLTELLCICADINPDFMNFAKQCQYLTRFGVLPKYPNELQINKEDAKTAIRFAEEIKEFVVNITQIINNE
ncbi:MAG: HEPN domain-containing protein [Firmicutes bacterium]|nr:HEPN domain-containing protein [Bacillota bacterium]MCL2312280.1 HEPN domain-containing protein [Bacillota bacterium]